MIIRVESLVKDLIFISKDVIDNNKVTNDNKVSEVNLQANFKIKLTKFKNTVNLSFGLSLNS